MDAVDDAGMKSATVADLGGIRAALWNSSAYEIRDRRVFGRLRVRQLTDDQVMAKPVGGDRDFDSSRDESTNVALAEEIGVSEPTMPWR